MRKQQLKQHYLDHAEHEPRTLCGKAVNHITGSPLNSDGSVPGDRVTTHPSAVTCRTCAAAIAAIARSA